MKKIGFILVISILLIACNDPVAQTNHSKRDTTITVTNSYSELFFDSLALEKYIAHSGMHDTLANNMRNFYNSRNYQYAWFMPEGMADYATTFLGMQDGYTSYSGDSSLYSKELQVLTDSMQHIRSITGEDSTALKTELLLTRQFMRYTYKTYAGNHNINTKDLGWYIPRKKINAVAFLDSMLQNKGQNLSQYEPVNRQYNLLKQKLLGYYEIEKTGEWKNIEAGTKPYREGDTSASIADIKHRLYVLGDLKEKDSSVVFTSATTTALKKYQHRYGLKEDGVAGAALIREMNRPIHERIRQLLLNMERMRWVPATPTVDYFLVNIPEFRLHVYEKGKYAWSMDVVVGSSAHNTVIFNGDMKYVVFSPYWNVPQSIIRNEVLPGIKRNKNYLANHNMEWNNGAVRQKPGPRNSLGLVKFLFPNSYSIYLHDTPSKSLFGESSRAFSHGCIRLAEPQKLAEYILRNDNTWPKEKIITAMKSGKEKYVTISPTIPVFIGYFTAWVDHNGDLNFRDDIYGHDKKMAEHYFTDRKISK